MTEQLATKFRELDKPDVPLSQAIEYFAIQRYSGNSSRATRELLRLVKQGKISASGIAKDGERLPIPANDFFSLIIPSFGSPYTGFSNHLLVWANSRVRDAIGIVRAVGEPNRNARPNWPAPKPLPAGLLSVAQFDEGFLPRSISPWVLDIADRMQCPPDFVAVPAVVALGSVIGRKVGIRPQRRTDWICVNSDVKPRSEAGRSVARAGGRRYSQLRVRSQSAHCDAIVMHELGNAGLLVIVILLALRGYPSCFSISLNSWAEVLDRRRTKPTMFQICSS